MLKGKQHEDQPFWGPLPKDVPISLVQVELPRGKKLAAQASSEKPRLGEGSRRVSRLGRKVIGITTQSPWTALHPSTWFGLDSCWDGDESATSCPLDSCSCLVVYMVWFTYNDPST